MLRKEEGFTLIELVVVIVIIGILAAIALPRFMDMADDAKIAATKGNLSALRGGINLAHAKILATGNNTGAGGDNPDWPTIAELENNELNTSEGAVNTTSPTTSRPQKVAGHEIYQPSEPEGLTLLPAVQLPEMHDPNGNADDIYPVTASEASFNVGGDRTHGTGDEASRWAYYPGDEADSNIPATFYVLDGWDVAANEDGDNQLPYEW